MQDCWKTSPLNKVLQTVWEGMRIGKFAGYSTECQPYWTKPIPEPWMPGVSGEGAGMTFVPSTRGSGFLPTTTAILTVMADPSQNRSHSFKESWEQPCHVQSKEREVRANGNCYPHPSPITGCSQRSIEMGD